MSEVWRYRRVVSMCQCGEAMRIRTSRDGKAGVIEYRECQRCGGRKKTLRESKNERRN